MRILQICFTKIVNSAGGAEKVFCNMSNYFCSSHSVINVCCDDENGMPFYHLDSKAKFINIAEGKHIKVPFRIKLKNEIVRIFKQLGMKMEFPKEVYIRKQIAKGLLPILESEKPDIILCYELRSMVAVTECGYPLSQIVVMFHMDANSILKSLSAKQENILRNVKSIQVLLESYERILRTEGYADVVCIGNIVPQYDDIEYSSREKIIIHVGRLDNLQKRQHLLIEAFAKIADKHPDWKVKFFGGDSYPLGYEDELRNLIIKNKLENSVFLKGKTSDIDAELKKASIFAFPSAFEGFPLALTEGMSMGLPAVGFKSCPAVNELIKDGSNGILCDESIDALASALEELINNEEKRISYGKQAREDMKQYYADNIYAEWDRLIEKVLQESK